MNELRMAVIGYGNMGSAHAAAIAAGKVEGMRLCAVCDIDPLRLSAAGKRHPDAARFEDYRDCLAGPVDAVIIAVPHPMHAEIALAALAAGRHVLTEKPIDVRVSKARALCEAARRSDRVFGIMLNQRTSPIFQRARQIVRGGELGRLKRSVWIITNWYRTQHYYDSGTWRATWAGEGGGVLLNQAPHNLDLWQWICGMPAQVRAFCDVARYHRIEVEDDAMLMTRNADGATGVFITSTGEYPGTNRLEISGEKGKLVLENGALKWWRLRRSEEEVRFQSDESMPGIPYEYLEHAPREPESGHVEILRNFAGAILRGEPLLAPGEDGLNELILSNAAYLSAWTGSAEIALPMDDSLFDRLLDERAATSRYKPSATPDAPSGSYSERWKVKW